MEQKNDFIISKMFRGSLLVMILSTITATLGMLVDGIIIGNCLGVDAMAAYGIVSPVFIVSAAVAGVFSAGCQTLCASRMGSGKMKEANGIFSLTCVIGMLVSVLLIVLIVPFAKPIGTALGASGSAADLLPMVRGYMIGLAIGFPGMILTGCLQPIMQLDGDPSRAFKSVVVMTVVNIACDLVNVFVVHGGMLGMAIATTVSYYAGLVVLWLHFSKKEAFYSFSLKEIPWKESGSLVFTGLPTAVNRVCGTLRTLILNRLLLQIAGSVAVAAFSVQSNMHNLFGAVGAGVGMATLLIAGVVVGERDRTSTKGLLKTSIVTGFPLVTACALILFIGAPAFVRMYVSPESETYAIAIQSVRIFAVSMPFHVVSSVFINYFQGIRKLLLANLTCILNELVFVILCAFPMSAMMGLNGVWAAFPVSKFLMLVMIVVLAAIAQKRMPRSLDDFLFLPKDFDVPETDRIETSAVNLQQIIAMSEEAKVFCRSKGISDEKSYYVALCIEEMARNILDYGFTDGKRHSIDVRLTYRGGNLTIRIRDDCKPFDPQKWLEIHQPEDPLKNIGIHMVNSIAEDLRYINTMNTNNLIIAI